MSDLNTLTERRTAVVSAMRNMTDAATQAGADFDDAQQKQFDEHRSSLASLDKQIENAKALEEAERKAPAITRSAGRDGSYEDAAREFSITRAISAAVDPSVDAGREAEISRELAMRSGRSPNGILIPHEALSVEKRAATTSTQAAEMIATVHQGSRFIDTLNESLQVGRLGCTVMSGLQGNQSIPRLTQNSSAYWIAEHEAVTQSNHDFDSIQLTPKTVAAQVEYSRRLLINSVPSVEDMVRRDLGRVLAQAIDTAAINSDGTGNRPTGLLNIAGTTDIANGTDGGALTWEQVLEFENALKQDNALMGNLAFLTSPKVVKKLRSTVRVASTDSSFIMNDRNSLAGHRIAMSNHVPDDLAKGSGTNLSALIFGDWSSAILGYWSGIDVVVNPYADSVYSKGGLLLQAMQDVDFQIRHPESFAISQDVDAS